MVESPDRIKDNKKGIQDIVQHICHSKRGRATR